MLLSEEERLLQSTVREFADQVLMPRAAEYDENCQFPWENIRDLASLGLFGLTIDEDFNGNGGTIRQLAIVVEEIARGCGSTSVIYVAHLGLCAHFISRFGNKQQKSKWMPPLAKAEKIGAFALTEPLSGSDAAALRTNISTDGDNYVINGTKLFTTNAEEADLFIILGTHDRSQGSRAVDALIVERGIEGFKINPQHGKMGMRATSTAELIFEDCRVPKTNLVGLEGEGFRQTMNVLNSSRIAIASQCVGLAQAAYNSCYEYARQRELFSNKLVEFQGIQWILAEMATNILAARGLVMHAATLYDNDMPFIAEASMAKLFASRVAVEAADKAVQIHGVTGYFAPTIAERLYRDAKLTEIYEGTSEIQRTIIARNLLEL